MGGEPLFEMAEPGAAPTAKVTERDMLDALNRRFTALLGNGDRWVRAEHVRNGTGFYGHSSDPEIRYAPLRTADFMALDCWESKGHQIHGVEVKVSRSDWLTELKDPEKAETFKRYCHRWWLAVSDASIVRDDLPDGWGLLVLMPNGQLRAKKQAPKLTPEPMPMPIQFGLARAVQKTSIRAGKTEVGNVIYLPAKRS